MVLLPEDADQAPGMHQMQHLRRECAVARDDTAARRLQIGRQNPVRQLDKRQPQRHQQRHLPGQEQEEGEQDDGGRGTDDRAEQGLDSVGRSPGFIGDDIRLAPIILKADMTIPNILEYYMGKNTPARQDFIIDNLKIEKDLIEEEKEVEEAA